MNHRLNHRGQSLRLSRSFILESRDLLPVGALRLTWTKASVDPDNHRRISVAELRSYVLEGSASANGPHRVRVSRVLELIVLNAERRACFSMLVACGLSIQAGKNWSVRQEAPDDLLDIWPSPIGNFGDSVARLRFRSTRPYFPPHHIDEMPDAGGTLESIALDGAIPVDDRRMALYLAVFYAQRVSPSYALAVIERVVATLSPDQMRSDIEQLQEAVNVYGGISFY